MQVILFRFISMWNAVLKLIFVFIYRLQGALESPCLPPTLKSLTLFEDFNETFNQT